MANTQSDKPTPSLAQVIQSAIDADRFDLHTCIPGVIDSYDPATGLASVQPALKRKYVGKEAVNLPVIKNVPVLMPRAQAGATFISLPLKQGDPVTLVFSERSLDVWKSTTGGQTIDPDDPRKHALSDAYCFPGGYPKAAAPMTQATADDLVVVSGDLVMTLTKTGKVKVTNAGGTVELISTLSKVVADVNRLMTDIQGGLVTTMLGPMPLVMSTFATDLATLVTDKATLDTFKA